MKKILILICAGLLLTSMAYADLGLAFGGVLTTVGPGVEVAFRLMDWVNIRAVGTYLAPSINTTASELLGTYESFGLPQLPEYVSAIATLPFDMMIEPSFITGMGLVDLHPFGGMLHVSAGVAYTQYAIRAALQPTGAVDTELFGIQVSASEEYIGDIALDAFFGGNIAYYVGAGIGNPVSKKGSLLMSLEAGLFVLSSPIQIDMENDGIFKPTTDQDALINENLAGYIFLPMVSFSLTYKI